MNSISGKIVLDKNGIGIPNLLVVLYDVDGVLPEEGIVFGNPPATTFDPSPPTGANPNNTLVFASPETSTPNILNILGDRLGSVLTGADGSFSLSYEDSEFQFRFKKEGTEQEKRPDIWLLVFAPQVTGKTINELLVFMSPEIRQNAGRTENYFIQLTAKQLDKAGLPVPFASPALTLPIDEPEPLIQQASQSVSRQVKLKQEVRKIATQQVTKERQRVAQVESEVERRLLEKLTGVPDTVAERLNYVRPGANVESAMFRALNKTIERSINPGPPVQSFVVLPSEQAEKFQNPDGSFRQDISPEELDPFLFGSVEQTQRASFLLREDPLQLLRQAQTEPELFLTSPPEADRSSNSSKVGPREDAASGREGEPPPAIVAEFINRLISTMVSPEEAVSLGVKPRSTQEVVDNEIGNFQLRAGPADVPAFYDFHSLEIAYDYVWQKAIDEEVIEKAQDLGRQLLDLGGDPLGALGNGSDPMKALRKELRLVQNAHADSNLNLIFRKTIRNPETNVPGSVTDGEDTSPRLQPGVPPLTVPTSGTLAPPDRGLPHELLNQIETLLNERFSFEIFAPGSVNFGILVTYRQFWTPVNYQVGDLVKTITLTPKEERTVTTKRVVKKDRSVKEMENSLRIRKDEQDTTARDEAEIVAKAEAKTNFNLTAQGTFNIGIASGDATTVFGKDAATNSSDTKKAFREAVVKAAQELKDERKLEVETKEVYESETSETTKITNPNDELAVTYLFYELQRRYKIAERIHRLTPVVMVAMDVPNPSRQSIDTLLLKYGWIIDRVLLDDQFRRPLEYFRTKIVGEEVSLAALGRNVSFMIGVVDELKRSYSQARTISNQLADLLTASIVKQADSVSEDNTEGALENTVEFFFGEDDTDKSIDPEKARILVDSARERFERAVNQEKALRAQLDSETAALKIANDALAKAQAEHLNCLMDLGTFRLHIKENILYYMQAIWSHTFKDQLFLELHKRTVPRLAIRKKRYSLSKPQKSPASVTAKNGQRILEVKAELELESGLDPEKDTVTLAEVADLDNLMGFKGNYLLFPLRVSNALTDFMMTPFVDSELGLRDPDEFGNFTPDEFVAYARALHADLLKKLEKGEIEEKELQETLDQLTEQFKRLLSAPRRAEDEIVVPTSSLYIEALPAAHPILEDFKLAHRAVDVKKVQAEVRKLELDNLRYAARILEGELDDPDTEKKVIIDRAGTAIVEPS